MKLKKMAIFVAVLAIIGSMTICSSYAEEWPINGAVVSAGMYEDLVVITIKDIHDNYWHASATETLANELLATALTAIASGLNVMGVYDTVSAEWLDLMISNDN